MVSQLYQCTVSIQFLEKVCSYHNSTIKCYVSEQQHAPAKSVANLVTIIISSLLKTTISLYRNFVNLSTLINIKLHDVTKFSPDLKRTPVAQRKQRFLVL